MAIPSLVGANIVYSGPAGDRGRASLRRDSSATGFGSSPPALWIPLSLEPVIERENTLLQRAGRAIGSTPSAG